MIPLYVPSWENESIAAMFAPVADAPDECPSLDPAMTIDLDEVTRIRLPLSFKTAEEVVNTLARRQARLLDWMRWQLACYGQCVVQRPNDSQWVIELARHEENVMQKDQGIIDMVNIFEQEVVENEKTTYFLFVNSRTLSSMVRREIKTPVGSLEVQAKTLLPKNVTVRLNDQGYYPENLAGSQPHSPVTFIPDGYYVLVPMRPPLFGMQPHERLHGTLAEDRNGVWITIAQSIGFWQPPSAPGIQTYSFDTEDIQ